MRIPFLQVDGTALVITREDVRCVVLRRSPRSLRVRHVDQEPIVDQDATSALERLKARMPKHAVVGPIASHLDRFQIRHAIVQGPALDDDEAVEVWLQREISQLLPLGQREADYIVRIRMLEQTEAGTRALIVLARKEAVVAREKIIQEAGLVPVGIGSLDVAIEHTLLVDSAFLEEEALVLYVTSSEVVWLRYSSGILQVFDRFERVAGVHREKEIISHLRDQLAEEAEAGAKVERIYLVGHDVDAILLEARAAAWSGPSLTLAQVPARVEDPAWSTPGIIPSVGLALTSCFSELDTVNFLPEDVVFARRQEAEKKDAMLSILTVGAVLVFLFLFSMMLGLYLEGKNDAADAQLLVLSDEVGEIERARRELKTLEGAVKQAEEFVLERTQVALLLRTVAEGMPEQLWLDALNVEPGDPLEVTLNGVTFFEEDLAAYISALEGLAWTENVRLVYSQAQQAGRLYRKADVQADLTVTQFEIALDYVVR